MYLKQEDVLKYEHLTIKEVVEILNKKEESDKQKLKEHKEYLKKVAEEVLEQKYYKEIIYNGGVCYYYLHTYKQVDTYYNGDLYLGVFIAIFENKIVIEDNYETYTDNFLKRFGKETEDTMIKITQEEFDEVYRNIRDITDTYIINDFIR